MNVARRKSSSFPKWNTAYYTNTNTEKMHYYIHYSIMQCMQWCLKLKMKTRKKNCIFPTNVFMIKVIILCCAKTNYSLTMSQYLVNCYYYYISSIFRFWNVIEDDCKFAYNIGTANTMNFLNFPFLSCNFWEKQTVDPLAFM